MLENAYMNGGGIMSKIRIDKSYNNMEALDVLHKAAYLYVSTKHPKDYGTGEIYTSIEVHLLKDIADYPGITVTELARDQGKTKGAISQLLKKLENNGLVYREADPSNDNRFFLYITEKGKVLDAAHRENDEVGFGESMNQVRELYSSKEIDQAFSVLESWLEIRRDIQLKREERKKQIKKEERKKSKKL